MKPGCPLTSVAVLCLVGLFCQPTREPPSENPEQLIEPKPFVPPSDSLATTAQMEAWMSAGRGLDSVSLQYRDPLATEDPVERNAIEKAFRRSQDEACLLAGLQGGYEEYLWILQHVHLNKNALLPDTSSAPDDSL